ncbi:MAG: VCBS repeat-containing protein [Acidobacteriota bacterium]
MRTTRQPGPIVRPQPAGRSTVGRRAVRLMTVVLAAGMLAELAALGEDPALRAFDRELLLETTSETSAGISLGDIDGSGHLDIVLAKGRHWPINNLILRNDGKGHFSTSVLGDAPDRTYTAALADLDGDGHLDIVVSNDRPDRKLIYLNDGRGHFRVAGTFGQPEWSTRYVTVADLNGDKRPDLVVANRSSNPATPRPSYVCLNDGKGGFPTCSPLATESATIAVALDLDGDGYVDLFVPHRDGGRNLIFWNDGSGRFSAAPSVVGPEHSWIRAAAAADVNGDGIPDLVVGDERTGMFLSLGAGHRAFEPPVLLGGGAGAPYAIAIADLNRDGRPDIVVGRQDARGSAFFNLGGGRLPRFTAVPWNDGKGTVYGVAIGDLDGDGWPDIAAARSDAPNAVWFNGPAIGK